ncbi:tetratricopeptide repeat protein [Thermococcus sp.]
MTIKYEPYNRQKKIIELFKEAIELENKRELNKAKKKLDEILAISKDQYPEFYFEACFRLGDIFLQEDNYKGALKCAMRAMINAPNEDLYLLGAERIKAIISIAKENNKISEFKTDFETTLSLIKDNPELYTFLTAIIEIAKGLRDKIPENITTKRLKESLEILLDIC